MSFRNAVFIVTEEKRCPHYIAGEELRVHEGALTLPPAKATCLTLAGDLIDIISNRTAFEQFERGEMIRTVFECGGCSGIIRFEFKKEKEFSTPQMKLLATSVRREKSKPIVNLVGKLEKNETFNSLSRNDLFDLAALLELKEYDDGTLILQKGDPGTHLYILLSGCVEIADEEGVKLAEIRSGGVFGEVSLLSGDLVTSTVVASEPCQVALLSQKNFQHILKLFPVLQVFFYKLQAQRISEINLKRAEELTSGMVGYLSDIPPVELFQMFNVNMKSGRLKLDLDNGEGIILFHEGEIIYARLDDIIGKEAFYDILCLKDGRFKFIQGLTQAEKQKEVIGGFMSMLMEGMKRLDERLADE